MKRYPVLVLLMLALILGACRREVPEAPDLQPFPETTVQLPTQTEPEPEPSTAVPTPAPTATPAPTPIPAPFVGESVMGIEITAHDFGTRAEIAADAGAFWIRWNAILWSDIEPNPGDRNWESMQVFEEQVGALNEKDLKLIAIVRSTPLWAQQIPGTFCGPVAEESFAAFGKFMFDLVSRYSKEPYGIKYWEIGNEPDIDPRFVQPDYHFGCWGDQNDPYYGGEYYGEMLKVVYPQIKAADPNSQVLLGGLLLDCDPIDPPETSPGSGVIKNCTPAKYLEGILETGGGEYFDGVSFHAYDFYDPTSALFGNPNWHSGYTLDGLIPVLIPKARFIKSTLATYGFYDKLLFNSETSLLCGSIGDEPTCMDGAFDRMKADYVPMTFASAIAEGLEGNVWYSLEGAWRRNLLVTPAGRQTDAFLAFQTAATLLDDVDFWGSINEFEGVTGYKFRRAGEETWVIWSLDGSTHVVELQEAPARRIGVLGEELDPAQSLEITSSPFYLIWAP